VLRRNADLDRYDGMLAHEQLEPILKDIKTMVVREQEREEKREREEKERQQKEKEKPNIINYAKTVFTLGAGVGLGALGFKLF
jgi:hypothetical protein